MGSKVDASSGQLWFGWHDDAARALEVNRTLLSNESVPLDSRDTRTLQHIQPL